MKITRPKIIITLSVLLFLVAAVMIIADLAITNASKNKLYSDVESIPYNKTGLLLGTGKFLENGYINPYYTYRIDAAAKLIRAGKIKYLIISGDNSRSNYNEPQQMQNDLYARGIDTSIIYLDYAGFRTFDSMIRLKEIFGQTEVTVISQQFHDQRAIYIAEKKGISAIGFNCQDVSKNFGFRIQTREKFARVKVFLDFLFGKKPKFLGKKIYIP
ncbi:MAG TPA: ElyC/SanA/YdcF family protein [Puia sp.]|nr:ElyC/SanA/YdcF family protein [Puia sp.]